MAVGAGAGAGGERRWPRRFGAWARVAGKAAVGLVVTAVAGFFVVLGWGLARAGVDGWNDTSSLAAHGRSVDGVVTAKDKVSGPQGSSQKRFEVRFTTATGTSYRFWEPGDADVGDTVRVHYAQGRPETATTASASSDRIAYGLLTVTGAAIVIVIALLFLGLARVGLRGAFPARRPRMENPENPENP
ncbi:DUF3592 domain-containing protein [Streptomyces sp. NPDC002523]